MSEMRTFGFRTTLKSEHSIVRFYIVRISNVRALVDRSNVRIQVNLYYKRRNPNVRTTNRSDFRHKFVSEIRTFCLDFRQFCLFEQIYNRTEGDCLKSERVRISDVYCMPEYNLVLLGVTTISMVQLQFQYTYSVTAIP